MNFLRCSVLNYRCLVVDDKRKKGVYLQNEDMNKFEWFTNIVLNVCDGVTIFTEFCMLRYFFYWFLLFCNFFFVFLNI